jgi:hypothetical protein
MEAFHIKKTADNIAVTHTFMMNFRENLQQPFVDTHDTFTTSYTRSLSLRHIIKSPDENLFSDKNKRLIDAHVSGTIAMRFYAGQQFGVIIRCQSADKSYSRSATICFFMQTVPSWYTDHFQLARAYIQI